MRSRVEEAAAAWRDARLKACAATVEGFVKDKKGDSIPVPNLQVWTDLGAAETALSEAVKAMEAAPRSVLDLLPPADPEPANGCHCARCWPRYPWFRVCKTCGNKRCPHAENHEFVCTGSNEPGQVGRRAGEDGAATRTSGLPAVGSFG